LSSYLKRNKKKLKTKVQEEKKNPLRKKSEDNFYNHEEVSISKKFISQSDPFFTTGSGQNYISTVCLENQMDDENDESSNINSTEYVNNKYNRNISFLNSKEENHNENKFNKRNVKKTTMLN